MMLGRFQELIRPVTIGATGIALVVSFAAQAGTQRKPAQPTGRTTKPTRPTAHAAAPTKAQGHHKLRNRDMESFVTPAANAASHRLGFGPTARFLKVGDAWRYAWSFRKRYSILKRPIRRAERAAPKWGAPVVVDYRVSKVVTQNLGGRKRRVATITAIYDNRVQGRMQSGNELKVDHFFNPVERCVYTKWTTHGTCRDRDTRSVIRSMGSVPLFIGDIEREPAAAGRALPVNPGLQALLTRYRLPAKQLLNVPVRAGNRVYAHTTWGMGDLVPRFVMGDNIQGVLLSQRVMR
jgi:hypothetical protein